MYANSSVRILAVDGVVPTPETISSADYPYTTSYYAVLRSDEPEGSDARALVDYVLSEEGQLLANSLGYIPRGGGSYKASDGIVDYYGATIENTTMSSGTGGSVSLLGNEAVYSMDDSEYRFYKDEDGQTVELKADNVLRFINEYRISRADYSWPYPAVETIYNLVTVDDVTFDVLTDSRIQLSDLFYDGVNYIEYVNAHIFDAGSSYIWYKYENAPNYEEFYSESYTPLLRRSPFTGIPADYPLFYVVKDRLNRARLAVCFPEDNPFFSQAYTSYIPLPSSISPYGRHVCVYVSEPEAMNGVSIIVPTVQLEGRAQAQAKANALIRSTATQAVATITTLSREGFYEDFEALLDIPWQPDVYLNGDVLSVYYCCLPSPNDESVPELMFVALIGIDLATGEVAYTKFEDVLGNAKPVMCAIDYQALEYVPYEMPQGSRLRMLAHTFDGYAFEVEEPDGRIVRGTLYCEE